MSIENIKNKNTQDNFSKEKSILFLILFSVLSIFLISEAKDSFLDNYFKDKKVSTNSLEEGSSYLEVYDPIRDADQDNDGDGVVNWREIVSGTDPDDESSVSQIDNKKMSINSDTNLTNLLTTDLYTISKYKEKYPNMNEISMTSALTETYQKSIYPKRFIDLKTADSVEVEFLKGYGNAMADMFAVILSNDKFVELKEVQEKPATFTKTKEYLNNLDKICQVQKIVDNVPASYAQLHRDFIYNCELYSNIIKGIMSLADDEVRFLISTKKQEDAVRNIFKNFNDYSDKLKNDSVFFKSNESGYVFINKIQ